MKLSAKIITFILVFAMTFGCISFSASAAGVVPVIAPLTFAELLTFLCQAGSEYSDALKSYFSSDVVRSQINNHCEAAYEATNGSYIFHYFDGNGFWSSDSACIYCGLLYSDFCDGAQDSYNNYVSTLDTTEASLSSSLNFSVSSVVNGNYASLPCLNSMVCLYESSSANYYKAIEELGLCQRVMVIGISPKYFVGLFWTYHGRLSYGVFENPYGKVHASYYGIYDYSSLTLVYNRYYTNFYHPSLKDSVCSLYPSSACYVWDCDGANSTYWEWHYKTATDSTFTSIVAKDLAVLNLCEYVSDLDPTQVYLINSADNITWGSKSTLAQPSGTDETSRYGYLMHLINDYNTNNSYQTDPNAVNVYISKDDLSDLYSMNMFSEETLIFTEPQSGIQYQCENWIYDYELRSYALDLVDGTLVYGGTVIDGVTITYWDDTVTVRLWIYDSAGELDTICEDTYNYVAVSQSECALSGHSYDHAETPATCTNYGESVDTCTVCGETDREIIPALGHDLVQSVLREPSCSLEGVTQFDCSRCDYSYTGSVPILSHDFQAAGSDSDGNSLYVCSVCGLETTDYTGEGPITDEVGWWSWLQGWLADFKEWLGEQFEGLGDTIENSDGVVIDQDVDVDYNIVYTDPEGVEQETSIMQIMDKFAFLADIYDIGDTMLAVVQADAAAAYAVDEDGAAASSGAPIITVDLSAANSKYGYVYGGSVEVLDLSWYAPYKERVDSLVSGFLWLLFLWGLFKSAPAILGGVGLAQNRLEDIDAHKKGGRNK